MDFEVKPLKGVGEIEFGMSPAEVREKVGEDFKSFKRSSSVYPCDYFSSVGIFAYYKASEKLEALEFASPAQPVFEKQSLLGMGFEAAKTLLQFKDPSLEVEADGVIAHALGISLYAPAAKENPVEVCESVLVFESGYYD